MNLFLVKDEVFILILRWIYHSVNENTFWYVRNIAGYTVKNE